MTNKQFIVGPVELYESTKNVYHKDFTYFRTTEYGNMVKDTLAKLNKVIGNSVENSLIYLTASGTAAMEAVIENCCTKEDKAIVINGGTFGRRFCELLEYHNIKFNDIKLPWGEVLTSEHLAEYDNEGYTMLFVNLHETSTGQLYDIKMLSDFCKRNNIQLVVDAISVILCDEYDMEKYGVDVTITSSQKGLCLSPGLSFISFSQRMLDKIDRCEKTSSKYFDFKDYFRNITRGQTPYTPAVFIMYELADMLELIEKEGGVNTRLNHIKEKCEYFRKGAEKIGLKIPNTYPLSNMLTPLIFEDVKASEVLQILRERYHLYVNPCGGDLADKLCRVSHIGNTTIADFDNLLEKLEIVLNELKSKELVYDRK